MLFRRDNGKRQASHALAGRRRRSINIRLLIGLVMVAGGVTAAGWATGKMIQPDILPLRSVQVDGTFTHVRPAAIRAVMASFAHQGFVYVDTGAVRRKIESLPWVKSADVYRVWPDALRVSVTEQQAVARWEKGGLVNPAGELFAPDPASYPADLPLFRGPEAMQLAMVRRYREMQRILAPLHLSVARLEMDPRHAWRLALDNGVVLVLGQQEASHERLLRFVQTYNGALAARAGQIEQIDLRYTNGFAVRWRPVGEGVSKEMNNV